MTIVFGSIRNLSWYSVGYFLAINSYGAMAFFVLLAIIASALEEVAFEDKYGKEKNSFARKQA